MTTEKTRNLWGQDFRIVQEGLAETDVVIFVERLMRRHRERLKQLDHVTSLHELAKKTVQDAESLSSNIVAGARRESETELAKAIAEANGKAQETIEEANLAARELAEATRASVAIIEANSRLAILKRISTIESSLQELKESAVEELSTRMSSHYVGKHLYQSVRFLSIFENFIGSVENQPPRDSSC